MKPEYKPLVVFVAVIVGLAAILGACFWAPLVSLPATLPIAAGTVIHLRPDKYDAGRYLVWFNLTEPGRMVGGWSTQRGTWIYADWVNQSNLRHGWIAPPGDVPWNGTVNHTFVPGSYFMAFSGYGYDNVTITQTVQIVDPGGADGSHLYFDQSRW